MLYPTNIKMVKDRVKLKQKIRELINNIRYLLFNKENLIEVVVAKLNI